MTKGSITITLDGIDFDVDYTYTPPYRGARDSLNGVRGAGPPLEPDEDESIEIDKVYIEDVELTDFLPIETIHRLENVVLEGRRDVEGG